MAPDWEPSPVSMAPDWGPLNTSMGPDRGPPDVSMAPSQMVIFSRLGLNIKYLIKIQYWPDWI